MIKDPTASERQQRARERKREQGLVPVQVWVPPWGRKAIRDLESQICNQSGPHKKDLNMTKMTIDDLLKQFQDSEEAANGEISFEKVEGDTPVIRAAIQDLDEFPVLISLSDSQLLAVVNLWKFDEVAEGKTAKLDDAILRMNILTPLSAFAKMNDCYVIFGALSVNSNPAEIIEEITTLGNNVVDALEFCREFLRA